jgi:UPF0271 protein
VHHGAGGRKVSDVAGAWVDLNCDMGESFGAWRMGADAAVMPHVTSANIACGYHAGDPAVMRSTVRLAREHGVAAGAHPGFPDLVGFGRRELSVTPAEVEGLVLYQVGALAAIATAEGMPMSHVKPHGALYNMAAKDRALSDAIARAIAAVDRRLVFFGLAGSVMLAAGRDAGLRVAAEGFADRAYLRDGTLAPRAMPGAVITEEAAVVARALRMVKDGVVTTPDGHDVPLDVQTLCVHGDTPGAPALARALRRALEGAGIVVRAAGAESAA